jgi:hypothetical protein
MYVLNPKCLEAPGMDRLVEAYCKKIWEVSTDISRHGANPCTGFRVDRERKRCFYVAGLCQPCFVPRRRHSTLGRRGGDLEDFEHLAARQSRGALKALLDALFAAETSVNRLNTHTSLERE